jgi:hypothetical protein
MSSMSPTSANSRSSGQNDPELFFAMVRAIGTDSRHVVSEITSLLADAQYQLSTIQLSDRFEQVSFLASMLKDSPENERYRTHMNAGDLLRSATQRPDAAAVLGMMEIREKRAQFLKSTRERKRGRAYLLKSLMHPSELETLRRVYGPQVLVVSVFAPRDIRVKRLAKKIADSWGEAAERWSPVADELVNRDFGIPQRGDAVAQAVPSKYVIDVQKTFQKADLFISATAPDESAEAVRRLLSESRRADILICFHGCLGKPRISRVPFRISAEMRRLGLLGMLP